MFSGIKQRYQHAQAAFNARQTESFNRMLNAGVLYCDPSYAAGALVHGLWEAVGAFIFNRPSALVTRGPTQLSMRAKAQLGQLAQS